MISAPKRCEYLLGGKRAGSERYFIQTPIFSNIVPEMRIVREGMFGPVGVVVSVKGEDITHAWNVVHKLKFGAARVDCLHPPLAIVCEWAAWWIPAIWDGI